MPDSGGSAGDSIPQGNAGEVSPDSGMMARLPGSNISETKQLQTPSYWRGSVSELGFGFSGCGQRPGRILSGRLAAAVDDEPDGNSDEGQNGDEGK
jgi:hypothetical protein